jgi:hypothetical protein
MREMSFEGLVIESGGQIERIVPESVAHVRPSQPAT